MNPNSGYQLSNTSDYVSFILSLPGLSPQSALSIFFLTLIRIAPIVTLAPFLGAKLPGPVKIGILLGITLLLLPHIILTASPPYPVFDISFLFYGLKEFLMGMLIAFLISIPFHAVQSSGVLIDFLRGSSSLMVTDPVMQSQVSPIGLLYHYVFIIIFYQIQGPFIFFDGLLASYSVVPVDAWIPSTFFHLSQPVWQFLVVLLTKFSLLFIQLASPSIVAILMAEMFLGIANRLAPQVQIAFLGMALKSLLGILLLWAGWFFILQQLGKQTLLWLRSLEQLIHTIPSTDIFRN